jgi:hypothetical protein
VTAAVDGTRPPFGPLELQARRRLGRGLLAFGVAGLILLIATGWLLVGSLGAVSTAAADLETQRARLVALIPPAEAALRGSADTATNASTSLESSATAARDASALVTQLATAMDGMASAAQVSVLGIQPFASLSGELSSVADRSRALATDLDATAATLDTNVADSQQAAADLGSLADELAALNAELERNSAATSDPSGIAASLGLARIVLLGLLLWLAVPAVAATWLGWRWRRG